MIPEFVDIGGVWKVLPPGIHETNLEEISTRFVINEKRKELFQGLLSACKSLKMAGCMTIFLDGSYVSDKPNPGDYDVCWSPQNVDTQKLDPVFLDFSNGRKNQKLKYGGEFFPSSEMADGVRVFVDFFQIDKETGLKKGLLKIKL
ncbi:MAG: hypothetical protein GYA52_06985 [Chloroflexi bacterium]|nr:hypothetical protein [Chloroflexota bacterium]